MKDKLFKIFYPWVPFLVFGLLVAASYTTSNFDRIWLKRTPEITGANNDTISNTASGTWDFGSASVKASGLIMDTIGAKMDTSVIKDSLGTKMDTTRAADSLATKTTVAVVNGLISDSTELFFAHINEMDTTETVIATQSTPTLIGTNFQMQDSSGFRFNTEQTSIVYIGGQNVLANVTIHATLLETDGASLFSLMIGKNLDTMLTTEIDRLLVNNAAGAWGTNWVGTLANNDSIRIFVKNEVGTENVTLPHVVISIIARVFR